jgi:hypothetical protein
MHDIHKYKKALTYVKELAKLEASLQRALDDLSVYKKYLPAQECINVISDNLTVVKVHLNHQKKIVENKGKKDET